MAACHIRKNLAALRQFPRVALNNIRDLPEAFKLVGDFLSLKVNRFRKSFNFRGFESYLYSDKCTVPELRSY